MCHVGKRKTTFLAASLLTSMHLLSETATSQTMAPSFSVIGNIESFTLDTPANPMSSAKITVSNIPIDLPTNLLITMPGKYMTAHDIFLDGTATPKVNSGLAINDPHLPTQPFIPFEAEIIGNIVGTRYVASVAHISQGALHTGAGFIQNINVLTGEMLIGALGATGGARVRLNDPQGVYGLMNSDAGKAGIPLDARFELDPDNSPIHASTGFPVCIPRSAADPLCPASNRPVATLPGGVTKFRYTCALNPAAAPAVANAPVHICDPTLPAPLQVGDYVTYSGVLTDDKAGGFIIAAYGLNAELGIYTSPNTEPVYVYVEEALQGTLGAPFPGIPQEATTRFRIVGFTTDPQRHVEIKLVDSDRTDTAGALRGFSISGPAGLTPENLAPLGRFRFTWPSKASARAVRRDVLAEVIGSPHAKTGPKNKLTSGSYMAPMGEYIYPEVFSFGVPGYPAPVPTENFCFLLTAGGKFSTEKTGTVAVTSPVPFPASGNALSQLIGLGPARACDGQ
jgi:hypothetical protein